MYSFDCNSKESNFSNILSNILPINDKKKNKCHAINNAIFLNKSQAEKSRKLDNERNTLSAANFRTAGFPLALTQTLQVLASSCLPQQIFNYSSNLLTGFEKTAKEFALIAQTYKKYSQNCK